jgi:hypothetical protein
MPALAIMLARRLTASHTYLGMELSYIGNSMEEEKVKNTLFLLFLKLTSISSPPPPPPLQASAAGPYPGVR